MKVILLEEVRGKGGEGDIVDVARGFANNYLLRQGMAVKATPGNLKQLEQRRKNIAKREEVRISNAENIKAQLEGTVIVVKAKVGEEGQLFGSVTPQMVVDGIKEERDIDVDRRRVEIRRAIKSVGEYEIEISLYRDIKAVVKIVVVDEAAPEDQAIAEALGEGEVTEVTEVVEATPEEALAVEAAEELAAAGDAAAADPTEPVDGSSDAAMEEVAEAVAESEEATE